VLQITVPVQAIRATNKRRDRAATGIAGVIATKEPIASVEGQYARACASKT